MRSGRQPGGFGFPTGYSYEYMQRSRTSTGGGGLRGGQVSCLLRVRRTLKVGSEAGMTRLASGRTDSAEQERRQRRRQRRREALEGATTTVYARWPNHGPP
ncbi:hypothetical protein CKAH01_05152 [Colletotrichum kahawae]|uniref:Uncharacterized protein n=1 Tax=Colletotrichum kahawae TaxID=34407 RepID=A0AAD9YI59_COLKA|nr:hypothetical protein CKAH01_05152 [Colletotrichum kahawae]